MSEIQTIYSKCLKSGRPDFGVVFFVRFPNCPDFRCFVWNPDKYVWNPDKYFWNPDVLSGFRTSIIYLLSESQTQFCPVCQTGRPVLGQSLYILEIIRQQQCNIDVINDLLGYHWVKKFAWTINIPVFGQQRLDFIKAKSWKVGR